mmetsp:Transcript_36279/g.87864  ORF Transcript_36279/g.87864 Transcript_36279/m.87864 type:complete len:240 (+) Transcript_36279:1548-2267(+)
MFSGGKQALASGEIKSQICLTSSDSSLCLNFFLRTMSSRSISIRSSGHFRTRTGLGVCSPKCFAFHLRSSSFPYPTDGRLRLMCSGALFHTVSIIPFRYGAERPKPCSLKSVSNICRRSSLNSTSFWFVFSAARFFVTLCISPSLSLITACISCFLLRRCWEELEFEVEFLLLDGSFKLFSLRALVALVPRSAAAALCDVFDCLPLLLLRPDELVLASKPSSIGSTAFPSASDRIYSAV